MRRRRRRILLPCFANAKPLPESGNNNYLGSECLHLPEAGYIYIGIRPYLGNVAKLIRRRRISLKRDNHLNPSLRLPIHLKPTHGQKHGAACTARMQPARAHCIANNPRTVQRSAAQRSVSQPARSASVRAQRSASQTIRAPCSAAQRANATRPRALHRKQSAHRAAHSPH